jgi:long-chain acyl-CoA synthetase
LYDTLGPDACSYIINQTETSVVIVEDDKKVNLLLDKAPK